MKKYLPFIFPSIAVLIVIFLAVRWYNLNTSDGQINEFAQGVDIESLSVDEIMSDTEAEDLQEVELVDQNEQPQGAIRYSIDNDKVKLSVMTYLPDLESGFYQVWFKEIDSDAVKKAFVLTFQKGGYIGNAAISSQVLPFEVVITKEDGEVVSPGEEILKAVINEAEMSEEN